MKKYIITLSRVFPVTHPRKGEPTGFEDALRKTKMHTIRANFEFWEKRFKEIDAGRACLVIRQWTGKPYASKQRELCVLTKEDGIGLQKLTIHKQMNPVYVAMDTYIYVDGRLQNSMFEVQLSNNDGLSLRDWEMWFKDYDLSKPLAIIHFTKFRY